MGLNLRKFLPYFLKSHKERLAVLDTQYARSQRNVDRAITESIADIDRLKSTPNPKKAVIDKEYAKFTQKVAKIHKKRAILDEKLRREKELR